MRPRAGSILLSATIILVALVSCKDSTNPDPPGPPASFVIMSGNQQDDTVGQELPQPLVARITDASGTAVPGAVVSFVVTSGGGSVFSPAVQANAEGIVQNRWTLGTSTATAQEVEVRSVNPNTGAPIVFGRFQATARPDRPATLTKTDGDGQQGTAGAKLPNALRVRVTDQYGNPVPGVTVTWTIASGGGSVSTQASTTNATGHAVVEWTLGPGAGQGSVTATVVGLPSQSFSAFAAAGTPAHVRIADGNGQRARVATGLPAPLSALVVDANENPVAGVAVSWSVVTGNGTITPRAATTDANGIARADWGLGTSAGAQSARASVAGVGGVDFTATADPGNPAGILVVSGNGQSATVATTLAPLVVRVVDAYLNPIENVTVNFAANGGSLSAATATTNASGEAQTVWTLSNTSGPYTTDATVTGLAPAQFTATALAGPVASWTKTSGDDQSGSVGQALADSLTVRVLDQYGNPVSGVSVTWTPNGGGAVSPSTSATSSTGHASTRRTLSTTPGVNTTLATASGLSQLTFTATAGAGPAVTLEKVSGDAQSGGLNQPLANPLVVRLRDQYGNPVPGATVNWTVIGGGGSVSPTSALTNADGLASTSWTIGGTGANQVRAANGSLNVTFAATVTGLSAATVDPGNFRDRVGVIGQPETLTAAVRDANGVPIANATVDWVLTGGSGDFSTSTSTTDASGLASTVFTPGIAAGSNFVEARVAGATPGRYLIWTRALAPARVVAVTGDNQNGVVGQPMPIEIRARVEDVHGNGVYGDTVRFAITTSGGYVERPFLVTDSLGFTAGTRWIPGAPGAATVTATASGGSTTFDANVVASSSPSLFIENQPLGRTSPLGGGSLLLAPVTVRLVDAAGLPMSGVTVTWSHFGPPITTTTNSEGRSTASVRYSDDPGVQTATISAAGAVATLYIVVQTSGANVSGAPTPGPGSLSARAGTRVESPVVVSCADRQGGPSSGCSVRVTGEFQQGSGGTLLPAPGYRRAGETAYFWILPTTPATYYFWVTAPAGPNYTDARATP